MSTPKTAEEVGGVTPPFVPMGLKVHEEAIDGILYTTTTLTASEGLIILPKLVNLIGENGMALLMATSNKEQAELMQNSEITAALVSSIAERASEEDGLLILKRLLQTTTCDKIKVGDNFVTGNVAKHFDTHFAGGYMHLINVALWVGRASFGRP